MSAQIHEELTRLIAWCERSRGPDPDLDQALALVAVLPPFNGPAALSGSSSLDDMLPWEHAGRWTIRGPEGRIWRAVFAPDWAKRDRQFIGAAATEPLARRAAALRSEAARLHRLAAE